jgi:CHAD domain-containing protein
LRAALALFASEQELEAPVKALQDALGGVRDLQIQIAWLEEQTATDALGAIVEAQRADLSARKEALRAELERWRSGTAAEISARLGEVIGKGRLGGKRMRRRLERGLARVAKRLASVGDRPTPRSAHRLRIAVKKLRYLAELLEAGFPAGVRATLKELVPLQDTLGTLHDADVRLATLSELSKSCTDEARAALLALRKDLRSRRTQLASAAATEIARWRVEEIASALARALR